MSERDSIAVEIIRTFHADVIQWESFEGTDKNIDSVNQENEK